MVDIGTHTLSFNTTDDFGGKDGKSIQVIVYQPAYTPSCYYDPKLRRSVCK